MKSKLELILEDKFDFINKAYNYFTKSENKKEEFIMGNGLILQINKNGKACLYEEPYATIECKTKEDYDMLIKSVETIEEAEKITSIDEWHEDDGECLWWKVPIIEAPYVGSPLDEMFPSDLTHFTNIIEPKK